MSLTWNQRWAAEVPGEPAPPDALTDRLDGVDRTGLVPRRGRALDVACGRGTVAVWLALRGLAVDAFDVAPAGLALGRELAEREGVRPADLRFLEVDLDEGLPAAGPYDVVVCQRFRSERLHPELVAALAPGGLLVISVLSEVGAGPGRFRAVRGELTRVAADRGLEVVLDVERHGEAVVVARRPE